MTRSKVVLPHPDGPSNATSSPGGKIERHVVERGEIAKALLQITNGDTHLQRSLLNRMLASAQATQATAWWEPTCAGRSCASARSADR